MKTLRSLKQEIYRNVLGEIWNNGALSKQASIRIKSNVTELQN